MIVPLQYFKPSGKYYSSGDLETPLEAWDIPELLRGMRTKGKLPGLVEGAVNYHILIPEEVWGFPILIPLEEKS